VSKLEGMLSLCLCCCALFGHAAQDIWGIEYARSISHAYQTMASFQNIKSTKSQLKKIINK